MASEPVRVVCFDWGGVILRICRSFEEGCAAAGVEFRGGPAGHDLVRHRHELSMRYQRGEVDANAFFDAAVASTNGTYSKAEVERIHDAWLLEEYPGVRALVDELHTLDHISTAMLSNTNERHWARRARDFPTAGLLHHQHASHVLGVAKPDPAIYAACVNAIRSTIDCAPSQILFFDDLEENVEAARAAGWRSEQIDHEGDTAAQMRSFLRAHSVL